MLITLALWGIIPAACVLFGSYEKHRAVIAIFVAGALFLPETAIRFAGWPDYSKAMAPGIAVLVASVFVDGGRIWSVRLRLLDAPLVIFCFCPIASSLTNGLGLYDGLSASLDRCLIWGLPYAVGRAYLTDLRRVNDLALGVVIGGLLYVPLCLWEIRMSPNLHAFWYGFEPVISFRRGTLGIPGFRPNVFLGHGLAVGIFMAAATLAAFWGWMTGGVVRVLRMPARTAFGALWLTTVLCKALGPLVLVHAAGGALYLLRRGWRVPILCLVLAAPLYMGLRLGTGWSAQDLVRAAANVEKERGDSLESRLDNEDMLMVKALEKPLFGWAGWGRSRVYDDAGKDISLTDGLWIITLGTSGLTGLACLTAAFLLPVWVACRRLRVDAWLDPGRWGHVALALVAVVYMIDAVFNSNVNALVVLIVGATTNMALAALRPAAASQAAPAAAAVRAA